MKPTIFGHPQMAKLVNTTIRWDLDVQTPFKMVYLLEKTQQLEFRGLQLQLLGFINLGPT